MLCCAVAPPLLVVALRRQTSAERSVKYCLAERSKAMSVSPPPGGAWKLWMALGGGPGLIGRNECPASTDPYQTLRCVPVPVGPLAKTRPSGSTPTDGSPKVWIGATTTGGAKPTGAADAFAVTRAPNARTATAALLTTTAGDHTPHAGDPELERRGARARRDRAGGGTRGGARRCRRAAGDPRVRARGVVRGARLARPPARRG